MSHISGVIASGINRQKDVVAIRVRSLGLDAKYTTRSRSDVSGALSRFFALRGSSARSRAGDS